jgi:DNA-binding MarR family transcriptional regulator
MSRSANAYQALAEFRYLIRCYLNSAGTAAESVGLEPQQYLAMLQLRGLPSNQEPTVRMLADRLQIRHHTATELINRMEKRGLLRRERSSKDRRSVLLHLTPRGEKLLGRLVRQRLTELRVAAPALVHALRSVIVRRAQSRNGALEKGSGAIADQKAS